MSLYNLNHDYPPEWDEPDVGEWMEHQDILELTGTDASEILWSVYNGGSDREWAIRRLAEIIDTAFKKSLEPEDY